MEEAILFLTLASKTITIVFGFNDDLRMISLSFLQ